MFGNRLGWVLSLVLASFMGVVLWMLTEANKPSLPGEFGQKAAKYQVALPVTLDNPLALTETRDGGPLYREALAAYNAKGEDYEEFRQLKPQEALDPKMLDKIRPATDPILLAARCRKADIFAPTPGTVIDPDGAKCKVPAEQLTKLGQIVHTVGLVHRAMAGKLKEGNGDAQQIQQHESEARRWFEAEFTLGLHMYQERLVVEELQGGLGMMSGAARELQVLEPENTMLFGGFVRAYDASVKEISQVRDGVMKLGNYTNRRTGELQESGVFTADMRAIAQEDECDRVWRVEAILALGRMKFNANRFADQQEARRVLKRLKGSSDPVLSTAAKAAWDQTREQLQGLVHVN